jgi:TrmH family RNA methyltransferase
LKAINSRDNEQFKAVKRLVTNASERRKSGRTVLDGAHLLAAFLDSGGRPEAIYVSQAGLERGEVARLAQRSEPAPVTLLADSLFDALSTVESPTGVIAVVPTPSARPVPAGAGFVLALEDIQDPGNVGTLLRSAAAAGAEHVLLSPACAFAWSPKVLRAAMGAHFVVNIVEGADLATWVKAFRGTSIALDGASGQSLYELALHAPLALLVGNEGAGLSPALAAAATVRARIPMSQRMESLNAASAGTVALFEAARQRVLG